MKTDIKNKSNSAILSRSISHTPQTNQMLVVIDSAVDNIHHLATTVKENAQVLILDPNRDGVEQITEALNERTHFTSVHLIGHGWSGGLQLGNTELSIDTLECYFNQLQNWAKSLSGESLLIYGCQVAQGELGRRFLERLHQLTGANIAASTERVGNRGLGGRWSLDYSIGNVVNQLAFLPEIEQTYSGIFAPTIRFSASPSLLVEPEGTQLVFTFQLSEAPPSGGVRVYVLGNVAQSLNQLDLFNISVNGADFPEPDTFNDGFFLNITSQTATVSAPIFQDGDAGDSQTVTYTLQSGEGYSVAGDASQSTITFVDERPPAPVNNPPIANNDSGTIAENQVLGGNVLINDSDPDGDSLSVTAVNGNPGAIGVQIALPTNALLILNADGSYSYNPNGQFNGLVAGQAINDSFTYTIDDGRGGQSTATVIVTIVGVDGVTPPPPEPPPPTPFIDAAQYGASNPDLIVIYGYNLEALTQHYLLAGQFEGRNTDTFDENLYLASNPDLLGVLGANGAAATEHYIRAGYFEGRPLASFNSSQYLATNPDLINVLGNNPSVLVNHYINAGYFEGRSPDSFDENLYLASNPDLIGVFGLNGAAATEHYIGAGYFEGRSLTNFNASQYLASNPDLIGVFGYNPSEATRHYVGAGYFEGRARDSFNETRYIASYGDLITVFGYNPQAGTDHYIFSGAQEGRNPNLFNPSQYIASHADLIQVLRYNLEEGTRHYIGAGYFEGRATNVFDPAAYLNRYGDLQAAFGGDLEAATRHYIESGFYEGRTWF